MYVFPSSRPSPKHIPRRNAVKCERMADIPIDVPGIESPSVNGLGRVFIRCFYFPAFKYPPSAPWLVSAFLLSSLFSPGPWWAGLFFPFPLLSSRLIHHHPSYILSIYIYPRSPSSILSSTASIASRTAKYPHAILADLASDMVLNFLSTIYPKTD